MGMVFAVNHYHRSDGTAAETGDCFQGPFPVFRGFTAADVQLALKLFQDAGRAADVTGSAHTDCGDMFTSWLEAESPVKGGHRNDINQRNF
jgi:hypothetical protein